MISISVPYSAYSTLSRDVYKGIIKAATTHDFFLWKFTVQRSGNSSTEQVPQQFTCGEEWVKTDEGWQDFTQSS